MFCRQKAQKALHAWLVTCWLCPHSASPLAWIYVVCTHERQLFSLGLSSLNSTHTKNHQRKLSRCRYVPWLYTLLYDVVDHSRVLALLVLLAACVVLLPLQACPQLIPALSGRWNDVVAQLHQQDAAACRFVCLLATWPSTASVLGWQDGSHASGCAGTHLAGACASGRPSLCRFAARFSVRLIDIAAHVSPNKEGALVTPGL